MLRATLGATRRVTPRVAVVGGAMLAAAGGSAHVRCNTDQAHSTSKLEQALTKYKLARSVDEDGDGKLSQAEIEKVFSAFDSNHDGHITFDE